MGTPFLVPWLMILVEEMCGKGRGMVWYGILYAVLVLSVVVLYMRVSAFAFPIVEDRFNILIQYDVWTGRGMPKWGLYGL